MIHLRDYVAKLHILLAKTLHSVNLFCTFAQKKSIMAKYLFARYIWEITTIYRAKRLTLKELNERWRNCYLYDGKDIPRRTFDYHRKEIEMLFNLNIVCDKRDNTYHVEDDSCFRKGELRQWLVNSVAVSSIMREAEDLESRIALEPIPSSMPFLTEIIRALRENKVISFSYQSFDRDNPTQHTFLPYALKLFRQRWYIVGRSLDNEKILTFATDRLDSLIVEEQTFKYPNDFDINDYYRDSFGIIIEDGIPCEHIVIKVASSQVKYLRSLPLHHSQRETVITPEYSIVEYDLKPTYDFEQEILSHREDFEILKPASLRDRIKSIVNNMYERYFAQNKLR